VSTITAVCAHNTRDSIDVYGAGQTVILCCGGRSLDSTSGVGYWTDYLKTFLHPRSLYQLPGVWQGQGRFGAFGEGKGLLGVSETRDDVMDRIRYWAEECDTFQVLLHPLQVSDIVGRKAHYRNACVTCA